MEIDPRIKGSILEEEPPSTDDFVNRVKFCAKALAYGAVNDLWISLFVVRQDRLRQPERGAYTKRFNQYFYGQLKKIHDENEEPLFKEYYWKGKIPHISFLEAFGYVTKIEKERYESEYFKDGGMMQIKLGGNSVVYQLTIKAYDLLKIPNETPKIFISYRRGVSTVLGLLVEARLRALSDKLNPYIDKFLEAGKPWEDQLKKRIEDCSTFISLVGSKDSFSENVMNEIRWAKEAGKPVISIWHGELDKVNIDLCSDDELAEYLGKHHAILVKGKEAIDYETAITLLENELHYF